MRKRPTLEMGMEKADSISILYKMANGKIVAPVMCCNIRPPYICYFVCVFLKRILHLESCLVVLCLLFTSPVVCPTHLAQVGVLCRSGAYPSF